MGVGVEVGVGAWGWGLGFWALGLPLLGTLGGNPNPTNPNTTNTGHIINSRPEAEIPSRKGEGRWG